MESLVLVGLIAAILLVLVFAAVVLKVVEWLFPSMSAYLDEHMPEKEWTKPW